MADRIFTHVNPIAQHNADFIVMADVRKLSESRELEQLWCRALANSTYELCCIPFIYNEATLGDVVEALPDASGRHMITRVVRRGPGRSFRVVLAEGRSPGELRDLIARVESLQSAKVESYSDTQLCLYVDEPSEIVTVERILNESEQTGMTFWENVA